VTELLPSQRLELDALDERKWDLLNELQVIELAKSALLAKIKGSRDDERTIPTASISD